MVVEKIEDTYCADFETTGLTNLKVDGFTRVYLWSLVSLDGKREYYGFNISSFLQKIVDLKAVKIWFHNLRFDGSFIIDYMARHGFTIPDNYDCIIDGLNTWYQITIKANDGEIKLWDSLKKFPGQSVQSIAKMYKIEGKKDKPDFNKYIPDNYIATKEEIEYCLQDSRIIAHAMYAEYKQGHKSMTLSSDAFKSVQKTLGGYMSWRSKMPVIDKETDAFIRDSYKGGFVYVNPRYQDKELDNITVYDVNSLYPHVMRNCILPWGSPLFKKTKPSSEFMYVTKFKCEFALKDGYLPTVQVKHNPMYIETQYLTNSLEPTVLTMTNIDYDLFMEHYNVDIQENYGYYFMKGRIGLLKEYIDYWMNVKIQATKDHNESLRYISKRYLNSPYGKTGMRIERINKKPYLTDDGNIAFEPYEDFNEGIYVPYASFVCAQARNITIRSAQKYYEDFVYADTDSLHLLGDNHDALHIDQYELGAWKLEGKFDKGKYLRPKTYIHADRNYNIQEIKCAGMPDNVKEMVNWDSFELGQSFTGKYMQKRVPGGVVLSPATFKIKKF